MFRNIVHSILFTTVASMAVLAQAQTVASRQEQTTKTSIIIDRQAVRFVASTDANEWRLEVSTQHGEQVFDSGFVNGAMLEWPLRNEQGETLESGLYAYTLTIKVSGSETPRTERGYIILD